MLDVFFTVDVEIWCDGWNDIDENFPDSYRKYIFGNTTDGEYGLTYKTRILRDFGLTGVFFVEPLFSARFGEAPLAEIVGILREAGQEIQLHLHTEWVDEAREPILPDCTIKRQHLRDFSIEEQTVLIAHGRNLLRKAGVSNIKAFRAGSFALNRDTLSALARLRIPFDSSYNHSRFGPESGIASDVPIVAPMVIDRVAEYPMTVFRDGLGRWRHAQLTACSFSEIEKVLWQALESDISSVVILSHNFELLNATKTKPDRIVVRRFRNLCDFLDRNRDCFRVRGFEGLVEDAPHLQPEPLECSLVETGQRLLEQAFRRALF